MGLSFLNRNREMNHQRALSLLSEYLDGRLPTGLRAEVERHLEGCQECGHQLRALQTTRQMLRSLPPPRLPRSFTLEATPRPALLPRGFFWLRGATATATALLVLLLVVPAVMPAAGITNSGREVSQATGGTVQPRVAGDQQSLQAQPRVGAAERSAAPAAAPALAPQAPANAPVGAPPASEAPASGAGTAQGLAVAPAPPVVVQPAAPAPASAADRAPAPTTLPGPAPAPAPLGTAPPRPAQPFSAPPQSTAVTTTREAPEAPSARPALAVETGSAERSQPSFLSLLQMAAGGLVLMLGLATGAIWWTHRDP